jgi:hypothetical protein
MDDEEDDGHDFSRRDLDDDDIFGDDELGEGFDEDLDDEFGDLDDDFDDDFDLDEDNEDI